MTFCCLFAAWNKSMMVWFDCLAHRSAVAGVVAMSHGAGSGSVAQLWFMQHFTLITVQGAMCTAAWPKINLT